MAKRKKKKIHSMPKLSFVDKLIYWSIFAILCVAWALVAALPMLLSSDIAFQDETVIASHYRATILWALISWMTFFLMTFIFWVTPYQNRHPLFGRRDIKYGPPYTPKIYPLFRRGNPHVWVSERTKRNRKMTALILLAVLIISFIPYPWAFYGRNSLHYDGSISRYNVFNTRTEEFSSGQIASVEFTTYRYDTGGRYSTHWNWSIKVIMMTDSGEEYQFQAAHFRKDQGEHDWLQEMAALKRRFDPSIISYGELEDLDKVISDRELNEREIELLYQLFGL